MNKKNKRIIWAVVAVILMTLLDQVTKRIVSENMELYQAIPLIPGVFQIRYIENKGAAWSILQNQQWFFILLTPILIFFLFKTFFCLPEEKKYTPVRWICVSLIAGAIGNLIDRIVNGDVLFQGGVVDFFDFCLINFPVFNVADIYVSLSVVGLLVLFLFYYKEEEFDVIYHSCISFKRKEKL